ncbi:EAL domain-containing protein [Marichromatium sp. PS1]|uniref:putative bifunctional diguanylate cyclase/phosphodiesterase n=1 Tax=Marichromatium sp. PS1 TaxID=3138932 RepID=UPI0032E6F694
MPDRTDREQPARPPPGVPIPLKELRQRAEAQLCAIRDAALVTDNQSNHELRVHQIELELQNEELRRTQEALELSRARYFDLYDLAPVGYLTLSETGIIQQANLAAETLLGLSRAGLVGKPLSQFILPEDQDIHYQHRRALWSTGRTQHYELRLRPSTATPIIWVSLDACLVPETTTDTAHHDWRLIMTDITIRKRDEQKIIDSQARLHLVATLAELAFWEWTPHTNQVIFPLEWQRQMGYDQGALPKNFDDWAELLHPDDREPSLAKLRGFAANRESCEIQYRLRCKDGAYRWLQARPEVIQDANNTYQRILLAQQDITRRKEAELHALRLAQHDPLTGLPTRRLLDQLANQMLVSARRSKRQLAVLFFDLDDFKAVNDMYGHAVGDLLLQAVAQRLLTLFRAEDIVARLGGDEFVAVLSKIDDATDVARTAGKAIATLAPPYTIGQLQLHCAPSLGISLYPQDGETIEQLMQSADLAMYHAKQIRPGHYQFVTAALNEQVMSSATLERQLRQGIAKEEFRVVYQPVLDLKQGCLHGAEALLRWPQHDQEPIPPSTFLPVAESLHLTHEIGLWVIREVCRQHQSWRVAGLPPIPISVNVSTREFLHPHFIQGLCDACQDAGTEPSALVLHLSESTLFDYPDGSADQLAALRALGVKLVIDDFGLGCSSLSKLDQLPLTGLQINQALVRQLHTARGMPAIIDTIIQFGRALGLDVTVVGIESEADQRFFHAMGCDHLQGFRLGKPMTGGAFAEWYRQHPATAPH